MRKISIIFAIVTLIVCMSNFALASWSWTLDATAPGQFDQMGVWWLANGKFDDPAFSDFTVSGWWNYNFSNTNAYAFGPPTVSMFFDGNFEGLPSAGTDFLVMASFEGSLLYQAQLTYDGSDWTIADASETWYNLGGGNPIDPATIPEPASMLLFGIGMLGFGIMRKRRKV